MMVRERRTGIVDIRKKSGGRASDEKIKSMASCVGRERDKLRKTEGIKYGKEGRTRGRVVIIIVKVEITSDSYLGFLLGMSTWRVQQPPPVAIITGTKR